MPPVAGTNLQIIDDHDDEPNLQRGEEAIPAPQQNNMTGEDSQPRRYPLRSNQRMPARYREDDN